MNILLCNDDGINAPGIISLASELKKIGKVTVVAPDTERSAASNSLTLLNPIRVKKVCFPVDVDNAYSVSGTPTDCAKIAIANLMSDKPDLVVSGINRGPNLCVDIFYSGTVAAAFEGANRNILSVALSLDSYEHVSDYGPAAAVGLKCINNLVAANAPSDLLYNINIPHLAEEKIVGCRWTKAGVIDYRETYEKRTDPYGKDYYWIKGDPKIVDEDQNCDIVAVRAGYVSITPLKTNLTAHEELVKLKKQISEESLAV